MATELHWLQGPWRGKVALASRPRGGDWLNEEIADWKRGGIASVVSLLTPDEERDLELTFEATMAKKHGLEFISFPIPDRQVPRSEAALGKLLDAISDVLESGKDVLIHCRQGVGRTGLVAACLLVKAGMSPGAAVEAVSAARQIEVPETSEQRHWIERYAPAFTK